MEKLGGYDALVNNTGIRGPTAPVEEMDPDACKKVMQVDISGTFNVTRLVIPYLKQSEPRVIINMSSVARPLWVRKQKSVFPCKVGIMGFTKTLSIELGQHNIRANAILPGAVKGPRGYSVYWREGLKPMVLLCWKKPKKLCGYNPSNVF